MQGTDLVYEAFLRPVAMQYEPNIEERFRILRPKLGQLLVFYLRNFTEKGYNLFQDVLRYVVASRIPSEVIDFPILTQDMVIASLNRIEAAAASPKNNEIC